MMEIVRKRETRPFAYEVREQHSLSRSAAERAMIMSSLSEKVMPTVERLADVIAATRPMALPMTWSMYPNKLWEPEVAGGRCVRTVTIPLNLIYWTPEGYTTGDMGHLKDVYEDKVVIMVRSEPCWEAYHRWSSCIIENFYDAMRAVREEFELDWTDLTKAEAEYSWDNLVFKYLSKTPVFEMSVPIEEVTRYGESYFSRKTRVFVMFELQVPNTPEGYVGPGCHVVEEKVEKTVVKTIRRIRCE
jgi:hypothetical protein